MENNIVNSMANTIETLRLLNFDPNCNRMNYSNIRGYYGELLVRQKLYEDGFRHVEHKGNQSGYDLEVKDGRIRIDVKTSKLKGTKRHPDWGWALSLKSKKKITCTHFVCVALDEKFNLDAFYIIHSKDLSQFPEGGRRFNTVNHQFSVAKNGNWRSEDYFKTCKELLLSHVVTKKSPEEVLFPQ
jgi:hypothetical protein